jgi:hypothetical protein
MLYQALHVPQGGDPPSPEIMKRPELRRYVQQWGQTEDMGFVATDEVLKRPVGAAWASIGAIVSMAGRAIGPGVLRPPETVASAEGLR